MEFNKIRQHMHVFVYMNVSYTRVSCLLLLRLPLIEFALLQALFDALRDR